MPGGLVAGCGRAVSYFPCTAWLWPEQAEEEVQPILQPPTQNLAEALIPPSQPGIAPDGQSLPFEALIASLPSADSSKAFFFGLRKYLNTQQGVCHRRKNKSRSE